MLGRVVLAALLLMALFTWAEALARDPETALATAERQNIELRQQIAALKAALVSCRSVCCLHTPSENTVGLNLPHGTQQAGLPHTKPGAFVGLALPFQFLKPCQPECCGEGVIISVTAMQRWLLGWSQRMGPDGGKFQTVPCGVRENKPPVPCQMPI